MIRCEKCKKNKVKKPMGLMAPMDNEYEIAEKITIGYDDGSVHDYVAKDKTKIIISNKDIDWGKRPYAVLMCSNCGTMYGYSISKKKYLRITNER